MGLYRRGKVWWMSFTYRGKQYRKSTETSDRKLARRIYDKVRGELAEGKWFERLPGEEKTFREMMERYLNEYSRVNKAPKTHLRDKSLASHLVGFFGECVIAEITPKLISHYKVKRREEEASPKTIENELSLMNHAFNLAIREWEWCRDNPVAKVSKEKFNNQIER